MGVSPMKRLRNKDPEIFGPADENVGKSRAGRPCHLRAIPPRAGWKNFPVSDNRTIADNEEFPGFPCMKWDRASAGMEK